MESSTTEVNGVRTPVEVRSIWKSRSAAGLLYFDRKLTRSVAQPAAARADRGPMSGHYATLLRGTVEPSCRTHESLHHRLVRRAHGAAHEGRFDLDDYVDYVIEMLACARRHIHIIAVMRLRCGGGGGFRHGSPARSVRAAVDDADGGPIDTRRNPTAVNDLAADAASNGSATTSSPRCRSHAGVMRDVYPGSCSSRASSP